MTEQMDVVTDDVVDDFCYEIAFALRRILNVGEAESEYDEETTED